MSNHDEFVGTGLSQGYSLDTIYKAAGDPDHPKFVRTPLGQTRIPTPLSLMVGKIIEDLPMFYGSSADFVRDALYHRAIYWLENDQLSVAAQQAVRSALATSMATHAMATAEFYAEFYNTISKEIETAESPQLRLTLQYQAKELSLSINDAYWAKKFGELA